MQQPCRIAAHLHMRTRQHRQYLHPRIADYPLLPLDLHFDRWCIILQTYISCLSPKPSILVLFHLIFLCISCLSQRYWFMSLKAFFVQFFLFSPLLLEVWIYLWKEVLFDKFSPLFVILLFFYSYLIINKIWIFFIYI